MTCKAQGMKYLLYFSITSMKEDTSAHLSGRGEPHGGASVITRVTLSKYTSSFKAARKNDYVLVFISSQGLGGASARIQHPKKDMVVTLS